MTSGLTIGTIARQAGLAPTTLRYYEKIGLLSAPSRVGGQRRYDPAIVTRLRIIALCKTAGFELDEIKTLLVDDVPGRPASHELATRKLESIDARIQKLRTARRIVEWALECRCPSVDDCSCGIHPPPPDDGPDGGLVPDQGCGPP